MTLWVLSTSENLAIIVTLGTTVCWRFLEIWPFFRSLRRSLALLKIYPPAMDAEQLKIWSPCDCSPQVIYGPQFGNISWTFRFFILSSFGVSLAAKAALKDFSENLYRKYQCYKLSKSPLKSVRSSKITVSILAQLLPSHSQNIWTWAHSYNTGSRLTLTIPQFQQLHSTEFLLWPCVM